LNNGLYEFEKAKTKIIEKGELLKKKYFVQRGHARRFACRRLGADFAKAKAVTKQNVSEAGAEARRPKTEERTK